MKLNKKQHILYNDFYESTHNDGVLEEKTSLLVGLAAAISLNCNPCTTYYLKLCEKYDISEEEIQSVVAKTMAVAAGQKRLQTEAVYNKIKSNKKQDQHEK